MQCGSIERSLLSDTSPAVQYTPPSRTLSTGMVCRASGAAPFPLLSGNQPIPFFFSLHPLPTVVTSIKPQPSNVPGSAAYFLALSEIRAILDRTRLLGGDKNRVNLVAGAAARAAVGFVMMPITVVKVRYEVVIKSSYSHTLSAHRALYSESAEQLLQLQKPIRCLLLHPTERWRTRTLRRVRRDGHTGRPLRWDLRVILRAVEDEVAWYAWRTGILVSFHTFAACGRHRVLALIYRHPIFLHAAWATSHDKTVANAAVNLTSGVMAGVTATCVTQPFDMLKTRMQLKPQIYRNTWQSAAKVLSEEGFIGFFDGITVRLLRKSLNSAVSWTVYEEIVRWYRERDALDGALRR
ncbi:mitochondrial carrier domain-containing protein [Jimgerdemannia flammicorona]|uniref:Mitochondrial carrier domain-containing protein n=1 Tax=Jimgerdemannia flammicorona TaxID=994334 RepID=A0A433D7X1_9FUNG|nr:mitochondrial carrier domain-containing protein [Jimgerdemannia flammicorona]